MKPEVFKESILFGRGLSSELYPNSNLGLYHGEINWLSFSTKLYQDGHNVCFVGCNQQGWYARPRQYGLNRVAPSAKEVIALLGVQATVAA